MSSHSKTEVSMLRHSKVIAQTDTGSMKALPSRIRGRYKK